IDADASDPVRSGRRSVIPKPSPTGWVASSHPPWPRTEIGSRDQVTTKPGAGGALGGRVPVSLLRRLAALPIYRREETWRRGHPYDKWENGRGEILRLVPKFCRCAVCYTCVA